MHRDKGTSGDASASSFPDDTHIGLAIYLHFIHINIVFSTLFSPEVAQLKVDIYVGTARLAHKCFVSALRNVGPALNQQALLTSMVHGFWFHYCTGMKHEQPEQA